MADTNSYKYLNLGCGNRFHRDWVNVDFISCDDDVRSLNLLNGLPFSDNQFDVVYHSHLLEHFSKSDGSLFIKECYRVLKPGGILRIVVPDLEQIASQYLRSLQAVVADESGINTAAYEWSVVELIDQMVRDQSGGEMARLWSRPIILNEEQIISRVGDEFVRYRNQLTGGGGKPTLNRPVAEKKSIKNRLADLASRIYRQFTCYDAIAEFRRSGESHKWMYDRYSLASLLKANRFKDVEVTSGHDSLIPKWDDYRFLDIENESLRKPDSLFMEAIK